MRTPRRRFPIHTWMGVAILAIAQAGIAAGHPLAATWHTPVSWTGYILAVDGVVARASGHSWLTTRRREAPFLVLASIGIWLLFEAYNFHLKNWAYVGLPADPRIRDIGYGWSFATILPGVFETADLVYLIAHRSPWRSSSQPPRTSAFRQSLSVLAGLTMVVLPLLLPEAVAAYLFGSVWLGFFFLVDPANERLGAPSLVRSWRAGHRWPARSLLLAGAVCGLLWETWNYQAFRANGAHWVYLVPDGLRPFGLHFGKMPVLGLLGFLPFALELFALYHFLKTALGMDRLLRDESVGAFR
ncbi:MAG TPA: hypothetical protein VFI11_00040 [Anaerolineales bacterium]|nr:hypothetical protein [Anaerolineales bacterium]